jgi:hypothetical protein
VQVATDLAELGRAVGVLDLRSASDPADVQVARGCVHLSGSINVLDADVAE